ncbi:MAG: M13 family metallopeptidase [Bacteroidia bacterium]|jgi:predicted metalloendopeptidase|nr:M13 family metallopeptidase [Bacteroidia bacterium]
MNYFSRYVGVLLAAVLLTAFSMNKGFQALNLSFMDTTINAGDDFYQFVNGKWMETAEIPADRGRWGSFDELGKKADSMALKVLEDATKSNLIDPKTDAGKAVTMFGSVMNRKARNAQGTAPLKPYLEEIDRITSRSELCDYMVSKASLRESVFLGFYVGTDVKNSKQNTLYTFGASKGLPDRDYYLKDDDKSKQIRKAYLEFMSNAFKAVGVEISDNECERIMEMETHLAQNEMSRVERRDPNKRYNPRSREAFIKEMKKLPVERMLSTLGIEDAKTIVVGDVKSLQASYSLVKKSKISDLKNFMKWNQVRGSLGVLSEDLSKLSFDFYGKTLRGTPQQKPLRERALSVVNGSLGEALGKLYVEKYFPEEAKKVAKEMVDDVIAAYRVRINNLDWMSNATKAKAQKKLDKLMVKIGYPDKWKDYSALVVKSYEQGGSYFENMVSLSKWSVARNMKKLSKPVDKTEWGMSPQTVNAYYNPVYNEIVFPAAILQPPFFDFRNDPAVNFGGIGAVIGHEISHGFDDAGAQFDENGNLTNWWTEEDLKKFKEKGKSLADQYSSYEALPGKFVNGEFTLGENIGDLGGVASAYDGLLLHLNRVGEKGLIDGFTQPQRFFISWATIWRNKIRDKELAMRLLTDPHSPGYFRAIGPLENHDGFYEAFDLKEGHKMYKAEKDRVKIW